MVLESKVYALGIPLLLWDFCFFAHLVDRARENMYTYTHKHTYVLMYIYELTCTYFTNYEFILKPQFISLQSSSLPSYHLYLYPPSVLNTLALSRASVLLWLSVSVLPVIISDFYPVKSESESHSVMSDSLQPHVLYSPWNSPGQNTGVGSCSLLQGIFPTQISPIAGEFFTADPPGRPLLPSKYQ